MLAVSTIQNFQTLLHNHCTKHKMQFVACNRNHASKYVRHVRQITITPLLEVWNCCTPVCLILPLLNVLHNSNIMARDGRSKICRACIRLALASPSSGLYYAAACAAQCRGAPGVQRQTLPKDLNQNACDDQASDRRRMPLNACV
jgi:hypothetical protein